MFCCPLKVLFHWNLYTKGLYVCPEPSLFWLMLFIWVPNLDDVVYELPVRLSFSFLKLCLGLFVHSYILCFPCLPLFCKTFLTFASEIFDLFGNPWLDSFDDVYGLDWYIGLHQ